MSKHPVGPWTETKLLANYVTITAGLKVTYDTPSGVHAETLQHPAEVRVSSGSDTRSGFNSSNQPRGFIFRGRFVPTVSRKAKFTTPRNASRVLVQTKYVPNTYLGKAVDVYGGIYRYSGSTVLSEASLPSSGFTSDVDETHNLALTKFINRQASVVKGIAILGEGKQTLEGFKSLANVFVGAHNEGTKNLVKALKGSRTSGLTALVSRYSDAHLAYAFAVKPALSDIHDLYTTTRDKVLYKPLPLEKVRASAKLVQRSPPFSFVGNWGNPQFIERSYAIQETIISLGASIRHECVEQFIPTLPELYGFSFGELFSGIWEATPYSWLSDYFGNLNQVLNLLAMHRQVWQDGWYVTIQKTDSYATRELTGVFVGLGDHKNEGMSGQPGSISKRVFSFSRTPYNVDNAGIMPIIHLPQLSQMANIAALVTSRLTKAPIITAYMSEHKARDFRRLLRPLDRPGQ